MFLSLSLTYPAPPNHASQSNLNFSYSLQIFPVMKFLSSAF